MLTNSRSYLTRLKLYPTCTGKLLVKPCTPTLSIPNAGIKLRNALSAHECYRHRHLTLSGSTLLISELEGPSHAAILTPNALRPERRTRFYP